MQRLPLCWPIIGSHSLSTFGAVGNATRPCATRVILKALPNFEVHFFESRVAPEGKRGVGAWAEYFTALHAGFAANASNASDAWDAFMANSMTFYTPDLTPFARKLRDHGVPMLTVMCARSIARFDRRRECL